MTPCLADRKDLVTFLPLSRRCRNVMSISRFEPPTSAANGPSLLWKAMARQRVAMRSPRCSEVVLGDIPPLTCGPRLPERRAVNIRWLGATVLLAGVAATLVAGALLAALGQRPQFAALPVFATQRFSHQMVNEEDRGDRDSRLTIARSMGSGVTIEQLNGAGSVRPFTRISARLAQIDPEPADGRSAPDDAGRQRSENSDDAISELPPIILFGTTHPSPRRVWRNVSAYAEDDASPRARIVGQPLNVTMVAKSPAVPGLQRHVVVARSEDTLSTILSALGATQQDQAGVLSAFPRQAWFNREPLSGGDVITVVQGPPGAADRARVLMVTVDKPRAGTTAVARTDAGQYALVPRGPAAPGLRKGKSGSPNTSLRTVSEETLRDSLYALAQYNHIDEGIVAELMRLCGHDFDLNQPLDPRDSANILSAPNELGQPELVFVSLAAQGKTKRYYRFRAADDDSVDFYDDDGRSVTRFLLRKPVVDGRLGDGFGWRVHPILGDRRFHEGVDYAAPYGSPVAAAGAGVVEIIGWEPGYGKYIRIRHDLGYETTYAHVAAFTHGLKAGDRVRQGETIAYVGSTGLSTGPHLYYEVWINGRRVNPLRIRLAGGRVLQGDLLDKFRQSARQLEHMIEAPADIAAPSGHGAL